MAIGYTGSTNWSIKFVMEEPSSSSFGTNHNSIKEIVFQNELQPVTLANFGMTALRTSAFQSWVLNTLCHGVIKSKALSSATSQLANAEVSLIRIVDNISFNLGAVIGSPSINGSQGKIHWLIGICSARGFHSWIWRKITRIDFDRVRSQHFIEPSDVMSSEKLEQL